MDGVALIFLVAGVVVVSIYFSDIERRWKKFVTDTFCVQFVLEKVGCCNKILSRSFEFKNDRILAASAKMMVMTLM